METIHKAGAGIMQILGIFAIYLFILMTMIGIYQVVTRYFFNKPSTVPEGLLTYNFTWMAPLVSAYVLGKGDRMRTGFLADKISGSIEKYLEVTIDLLTSASTGVVMVYDSISVTRLTMIRATASLRVPMGCIYVIVPVTGIIIMMFSLMDMAGMLHTDFSKKEDMGV